MKWKRRLKRAAAFLLVAVLLFVNQATAFAMNTGGDSATPFRGSGRYPTASSSDASEADDKETGDADGDSGAADNDNDEDDNNTADDDNDGDDNNAADDDNDGDDNNAADDDYDGDDNNAADDDYDGDDDNVADDDGDLDDGDLNDRGAGAGSTEPEQKVPLKTPQKEQILFDVSMPFTLSDVSLYNVEMETAEIGIEYFELEGKNEDGFAPCVLHFEDSLKTIGGGLIRSSVPSMVENEKGSIHAFSHAYVGNVEVYYMGKLIIYDESEDDPVEYIYYTTDTKITHKTVYAVLKEDEKIVLVYDHGSYYSVQYEFHDEKDQTVDEGPDGLTVTDIFGQDCDYTVPLGNSLGISVTIPRGYTAQVVVYDKDHKEVGRGMELGRMMKYSWTAQYKNKIIPDEKNSTAQKFSDSISINSVQKDLVVTLKYQKVDEIHFNAYYWSESTYAKERIKIRDSSGSDIPCNESNCIMNSNGNEFIWEFDGVTTNKSEGGPQQYTYEMDQLEINGESIHVPMTSLADTGTVTETTKLSTGTIVSFTVDSLGGENAKGGRRAYTLNITNCYEDLTITGGNMVGDIHQEYAVHTLFGFSDPQWYSNGTTSDNRAWSVLEQDQLIDRRNKPFGTDDYITSPFRFKIAEGYENIHVQFTTKEKENLQKDDAVGKIDEPVIEYLKRTDSSDDKKVVGSYEVVKYSDWKPSADGYYYCRPTPRLGKFMKETAANGVILLHFYTDLMRAAIDYRDGAGDGTKGPSAENISNMPTYQNGGEQGYNIANNATALVSGKIPLDKTGNFVFDHWEILVVKDNQPSSEAKISWIDNEVKKVVSGDDIHVSTDMIRFLHDCLYFNQEKQRHTLTLRAVWRESGEKEPIPYIVQYILADLSDAGTLLNQKIIRERTHTVNEGAALVTDLWQFIDGTKVMADSIRNVLEGDNKEEIDYTKEAEWYVKEPETTRNIESVSLDNNVARIYLVKKNAAPEASGSLKVSKIVSDREGGGNSDVSFHFRVELKGRNITGDYGDMKFENGAAVFELKHNETKTALGLPVGADYTVAELEADRNGYRTVSTGEAGTICASQEAWASFVNHKENKPDSDIEPPASENPVPPDQESPNPPDFENPVPPDQESPNPPDFENPNPPLPEKPNSPNAGIPPLPNFEKPDLPDTDKPDLPETDKPNLPETDHPHSSGSGRPNSPSMGRPHSPETGNPNPIGPENPDLPIPEQPELPPTPEQPRLSPVSEQQELSPAPEQPKPDEPVPVPDTPDRLPKTGDESRLGFWLTLLGISGIALFAVFVVRIKKLKKSKSGR